MRPKALVPWLVAAACFGPFGLAMLLYYGPWGVDWLPQLTGSRKLLAEPVSLPSDWRDDREGAYRWSLIYARMGACERECVEELKRLTQVHEALGRDQERVRRMFWLDGEPPRLDDEQLAVRSLSGAPGSGLAEALDMQASRGSRVFVADPQGDVILSYPAGVEQKELLRDLKRLLSVSGTG